MLLIPTLLCPKSWEKMSGTETQRFCNHCRQPVHNLDAMSASARLALLSSPAAKLCSRYQIAIRRPTKGREESYRRHLLKYGAAVAITGGALLVLWEMSADDTQPRRYRLFTGSHENTSMGVLPADNYEEVRTHALGEIYIPTPRPALPPTPASDAPAAPPHIDLSIDPVQIDQLFELPKPASPACQPILPDAPQPR